MNSQYNCDKYVFPKFKTLNFLVLYKENSRPKNNSIRSLTNFIGYCCIQILDLKSYATFLNCRNEKDPRKGTGCICNLCTTLKMTCWRYMLVLGFSIIAPKTLFLFPSIPLCESGGLIICFIKTKYGLKNCHVLNLSQETIKIFFYNLIHQLADREKNFRSAATESLGRIGLESQDFDPFQL